MNASYRIEVTEMQQSNFRNYRDHLRKQYTELNIWTINLLIFLMLFGLTLAWGEKLVDGKQVELEYPNEVWIRHTMSMRHHSKYHTLRNEEYSWELMVHPHLYMNIIQYQLRKPRQTTLRNWLQTTFLVISFYSELPTVDSDNDD